MSSVIRRTRVRVSGISRMWSECVRMEGPEKSCPAVVFDALKVALSRHRLLSVPARCFSGDIGPSQCSEGDRQCSEGAFLMALTAVGAMEVLRVGTPAEHQQSNLDCSRIPCGTESTPKIRFRPSPALLNTERKKKQ